MDYDVDGSETPVLGGETIVIGLIEGSSSIYYHNERDNEKIRRFKDAIEQSLQYGLDILVGPEYAFAPNVPLSSNEKNTLYDYFESMTSKYETLVLPGSCVWESQGNYTNSMPVFVQGQCIYDYDKWFNEGENSIAKHFGLKINQGNTPGVLSYKGLIVGLEICADHGKGILEENNISDLDLHIISSCGMDIKSSKVVSRIGGYVLHTDGSSHGQTAVFEHKLNSEKNYLEKIQLHRSVDLGNDLKLNIYHITPPIDKPYVEVPKKEETEACEAKNMINAFLELYDQENEE